MPALTAAGTTAEQAARTVARAALPGSPNDEPVGPLDEPQWEHLLTIVRRQRIGGLLVEAIAAGALIVTDAQEIAAARIHAVGASLCLRLERMLLTVTRLLADAGIPSVVLKGPAHAHLAYPDPAQRLFGDVDLLVRSADMAGAIAVLEQRGFRRPFASIGVDFDREFGKGALLVSGDGLELDLHRTLVFGLFGLTLDLDGMFEGTVELALAGRSLAALGPEERFLHACYHAALGNNPPRLQALRDVAQMHGAHAFDVAALRRLCAEARADAVVARAIRLVESELGLELEGELAAWAREYQVGAWERRAIEAQIGERQSMTVQALLALRVLPMRSRVRLVRALIAPGEGLVRQRGGSRRAWLWRGIGSLLRGMRP